MKTEDPSVYVERDTLAHNSRVEQTAFVPGTVAATGFPQDRLPELDVILSLRSAVSHDHRCFGALHEHLNDFDCERREENDRRSMTLDSRFWICFAITFI